VNEAEIEALLANVKRNKEPPPRTRSLQALNVRHKMHTERLEQVQRALDNEAITVEQVDDLKDALLMYIVRPSRLVNSWVANCCVFAFEDSTDSVEGTRAAHIALFHF
jgi:hypothetical protein